MSALTVIVIAALAWTDCPPSECPPPPPRPTSKEEFQRLDRQKAWRPIVRAHIQLVADKIAGGSDNAFVEFDTISLEHGAHRRTLGQFYRENLFKPGTNVAFDLCGIPPRWPDQMQCGLYIWSEGAKPSWPTYLISYRIEAGQIRKAFIRVGEEHKLRG